MLAERCSGTFTTMHWGTNQIPLYIALKSCVDMHIRYSLTREDLQQFVFLCPPLYVTHLLKCTIRPQFHQAERAIVFLSLWFG